MSEVARFSVVKVFDLKGRGGLLVAGVIRSGVIQGGMTFRDEETARTVRVIGIELHSARPEPDAATLVVDRRDTEAVKEGAEWVVVDS
ncbi:hypothetical protein [Kitasatospora kifunensis]|uniref:Uncharacterized protein n=1 Tax=Kitasatospora kifunensis TaxID=58351 RepID=A0A7W7R5G6_KITKI|nr:hypothetical protein [Kitasatospora kifunensis]MBB4925731.1 hypothetical protein [Kitasatospora kifunensis]